MDLLKKLPAYKGEVQPIKKNQTFVDIKSEVCNAHYLHAADYDKVAKEFWGGSVRGTAQKLFDFCKRYMTYVEESRHSQTTRSPAAILATGNTWGVDCKHYAGFIAGVLDALKRSGKNIEWVYRFASYDFWDSTPTHVFVVVMDENGNEIFIDPVLSELNARFPVYYSNLDKNCSNMLSRVSGTARTGVIRPEDRFKDPATGLPIVPYEPGGKPFVDADPTLQWGKGNTVLWLLAAGVGIYLLTRKKKING